jgi:hypothetical protein
MKWKKRQLEINRLRAKHGRDRSLVRSFPNLKVEQRTSPTSDRFYPITDTKRPASRSDIGAGLCCQPLAQERIPSAAEVRKPVVWEEAMKQLPTGKVKSGSDKLLELTDGTIQVGRNYKLPIVNDGATKNKIGKVDYIAMIWDGTDNLKFMVRLEDITGQGWQFEYDTL